MKSEKKNQSGFKKGQHTQTALLRVFNDFLFILDVGDSAILILIDLSAAFGTVDNDILSCLDQTAALQPQSFTDFASV